MTYARLPGGHRKFLSLTGDGAYQRSWLGPDHILSLKQGAMTERHRRLYFRDIQSITVHQTDTSRYVSAGAGVCAVLFGALAAYLGFVMGTSVAVFFAFAVAAIALISAGVFFTNVLLGPSCACTIHTAVQGEELFGLYRLRAARRFVAKVSPLIEQAQGTLSVEAIESRAASFPNIVASQYASPKSRSDPKKRHEHGTLHVATFVLLVVGSIGALADVVYMSNLKNALDLVFFSLLVCVNLGAIIRQNDSDIPKDIRALTWGAMIFIGLNFTVVSGALGAVITIQSANLDPADVIEFITSGESAIFTAYLIAIAIIQAILGGAGLIAILRFRVAHKGLPATPRAAVESEEAAS